MRRLFEEIIRKKLLPIAATNAIGGWVLLQVGDVLIGMLGLPGWTGKVLVAAVVLGLPLAWIYDWTPTGIDVIDSEPNAITGKFSFSDPEAVDLSELCLVRPESGGSRPYQ